MILLHKPPGLNIPKATKHFPKLFQVHHIGILRKIILIIRSFIHSQTSLSKICVNEICCWLNILYNLHPSKIPSTSFFTRQIEKNLLNIKHADFVLIFLYFKTFLHFMHLKCSNFMSGGSVIFR